MAKLTYNTSYPRQLLLVLCLLALPLAATAEIYKWVDAQGRVHFSDKKHASEQAKRLDEEPGAANTNNNNKLSLYPEADALLSKNSNSAQGKAPVLSAGIWQVGGTSMQNTSILRFDLGELLALVNSGQGKRITSAQLVLHANTTDKLYGQGVNNTETPGHSTLKGDNAFYLIPVHNSWQEGTVTWSDFYSSSHYTPSTIRGLPSVAVPGSDNPTQDFEIDVKDMLQALTKVNVRELTLELKLQRMPAMAQVTFHSREAEPEHRPRLVVELLDNIED